MYGGRRFNAVFRYWSIIREVEMQLRFSLNEVAVTISWADHAASPGGLARLKSTASQSTTAVKKWPSLQA